MATQNLEVSLSHFNVSSDPWSQKLNQVTTTYMKKKNKKLEQQQQKDPILNLS